MINSIWPKINFDVSLDNMVNASRRLLTDFTTRMLSQAILLRKKMAAVHFGTIPCGLYTACKEKSQIFSNIYICGNNIIYLKLALS